MLGFAGLYLLIGIVYVLLIVRIVARGPQEGAIPADAPAALTAA